MKFNTFIHALGAIGCIAGIYGLHNAGYIVWQWPAIALLWILSSYINVYFNHKQSQMIEKLDKERWELIEQNIKLESRAWDAEMKLSKADKK